MENIFGNEGNKMISNVYTEWLAMKLLERLKTFLILQKRGIEAEK